MLLLQHLLIPLFNGSESLIVSPVGSESFDLLQVLIRFLMWGLLIFGVFIWVLLYCVLWYSK
ncbi:hypothetical protein Hanom_Chr16g01444031 [Helianthus anomalus]